MKRLAFVAPAVLLLVLASPWPAFADMLSGPRIQDITTDGSTAGLLIGASLVVLAVVIAAVFALRRLARKRVADDASQIGEGDEKSE